MSSPVRTRTWKRCCRRRSNFGRAALSRGLEIWDVQPLVSTRKAICFSPKLLLLRPQLVDEKDPTKFRPGANTIVAVDCLGAGLGEMVMFTQGSSARLAPGMKDAPVDAVIIGIVDVVDVLGKQIFSGKAG